MNHVISNNNRIEKMDSLIRVFIYLLVFIIPLSKSGVHIVSGLLLLSLIPCLFFFKLDLLEGNMNKGIFCFLLIILISAFWALSPYHVFRGFLSPVLEYVILYYATINFIESKKELKITFISYWVSNVICAGYGVYQYFILGVSQAKSFVQVPNRLGSIMMIFVIFNFSILLFGKDKKLKLFGLIGILFGILGLFASVSRSALISLTIGLFVVSILKDKRMIIAFLVIMVLIGTFIPKQYIDRLKQLKDRQSFNVKTRIEMYETGVKLFKNKPLTGIGFNNVGLIYDKLNLKDLLNKLQFKHKHLHDIFINIGVELGIFGLLNFLFLLGMVIKRGWINFKERKNLLTAATLGIIAGQIFQNSVDVNMHAPQVGLIFIIFIGVMNLQNKKLLLDII
jgi:putative inorganic carbon (hco3(-)) transporter